MGYVKIGLLIVSIAIFLMKFLMTGTEKKAIIKDGAIILKTNKIYGIIGFSSILISLIIIMISTLGSELAGGGIETNVIFATFLFMMGAILYLWSVNVRIIAGAEKITYYNILRKQKQIIWKDIRRVIFEKRSLELILETKEERIKIHLHIVGFFSFIKLMKSKIDYNLYKDAISIIDTYKRRY